MQYTLRFHLVARVQRQGIIVALLLIVLTFLIRKCFLKPSGMHIGLVPRSPTDQHVNSYVEFLVDCHL